jgi:hypothetical protein
MNKVKRSVMVSFLVLALSGCTNDQSAENVLNAIKIISQLGNSDLNNSGTLTKSEAKYFRNSYCSAYELGQDYRLKTLKKKLGNDFGKKWQQTIPSLGVICEHWQTLEGRKPYRASREEVANVKQAMRQLERFRLFFVAWRKS